MAGKGPSVEVERRLDLISSTATNILRYDYVLNISASDLNEVKDNQFHSENLIFTKTVQFFTKIAEKLGLFSHIDFLNRISPFSSILEPPSMITIFFRIFKFRFSEMFSKRTLRVNF